MSFVSTARSYEKEIRALILRKRAEAWTRRLIRARDGVRLECALTMAREISAIVQDYDRPEKNSSNLNRQLAKKLRTSAKQLPNVKIGAHSAFRLMQLYFQAHTFSCDNAAFVVRGISQLLTVAHKIAEQRATEMEEATCWIRGIVGRPSRDTHFVPSIIRPAAVIPDKKMASVIYITRPALRDPKEIQLEQERRERIANLCRLADDLHSAIQSAPHKPDRHSDVPAQREHLTYTRAATAR